MPGLKTAMHAWNAERVHGTALSMRFGSSRAWGVRLPSSMPPWDGITPRAALLSKSEKSFLPNLVFHDQLKDLNQKFGNSNITVLFMQL
jgi:hypothetical protein